ncbi:MAG TPA: hypothetical protein VMK31_08700 [Sphingomicrobium sp.]|nr:hypothetical protein [Sphingomicrobium sp.]
MKTLVQIVVGLVIIWLAFRIIQGILGLLVGVAIAALVIYAVAKLIGGRR